MKKVVLLSCVSKKKDYETKAENLYDSSLFNLSLQYAKALRPDKIYILSALYGLLEMSDKVRPYNKTLNEMSSKERKEWSELVLRQMKDKGLDFNSDHFVILAGNNYRRYLLDHFDHFKLPLEGMRIGEQLSFLKRSIEQ